MSQSNDSGLNLDHLEALARAATPGEWIAKPHGRIVGGPMRNYANGSTQAQIAAFSVTFHEQASDDEPERQQANTEFAAAANPAAVLALIALARRAALANQPAPTVPAGDAFRTAVRALMEKWHNDAVEAGFGTSEAAADLDELLTAHQPAQEQAEPVAWAVFAENGNVRIWFGDKAAAERWVEANEFDSDKMVALYAGAAPAQAAQQEPVAAPQQAAAPGALPGWQWVPVEPNIDMVTNGFESAPDEFFSPTAEWAAYAEMTGCQKAAHRARLCYAAMLAAAPIAPGTPEAPTDKTMPGWERGIATVTLNGHQLREALDFINPDGAGDPDQLDNDLTFGIVQHKDDDGNAATGLCCWNDDTDGVLPLDSEPRAAQLDGGQGEGK